MVKLDRSKMPSFMVGCKEYRQPIGANVSSSVVKSSVSYSDLCSLLRDNAESFCRHYLSGGKRIHNNWVCADIQGGKGSSMSVTITGEKRGLWSDFATGDSGDLMHILLERYGSTVSASKEARGFLGIGEGSTNVPLPPKVDKTAELREIAELQARCDKAVAIWSSSSPLTFDCMGYEYLKSRGIDLSQTGIFDSAIRFYPSLDYYNNEAGMFEKHPALIGAVTDDVGNVTAVTRIWVGFFNGSYKAIKKRTKGVMGGGGIRLYDTATKPSEVVLCEGLETALSIKMLHPEKSVIACLGTSGVSSFKFDKSITSIIIATDNDSSGAGLTSAKKLEARAVAEGVAVKIYMPPTIGSDFNDDLVHGRGGLTPDKVYNENAEVVNENPYLINGIDLNEVLEFDSQNADTVTSSSHLLREGFSTGWLNLDKQLCSATFDQEMCRTIEVAMDRTAPVIVGGSTGAGKTVFLANMVLSLADKRSNPSGTPCNVMIFSMEASKEMYTSKLWQVSADRANADPVLKAKLDDFYAKNGNPYLYTRKRDYMVNNAKYDYSMASDYITDIGNAKEIVERRSDLGGEEPPIKNNYSTDNLKLLNNMLLRDNDNIGRICIPPVHSGLYPEQIDTIIDFYESKYSTPDKAFSFDVVIIDHIQEIRYEGEDKGISNVQGIESSFDKISESCKARNILPVVASQLVLNVEYDPTQPLGLEHLSKSKNIAKLAQCVILLSQTQYDRKYSYEYKQWVEEGSSFAQNKYKGLLDDCGGRKIGALRCHIVKSRYGNMTTHSTDCLLAVDQESLAILSEDLIDPNFIIHRDAKHKKDLKDRAKGDTGEKAPEPLNGKR